MKPIEIPDWDDDRIFVWFTFPQKGRKTMEFKLPRLDFIAPGDVKAVFWLLAELNVDPDKVAAWTDPDMPGALEVAGLLLQLRPHVTDEQFAILRTWPVGRLRFITDRWQEQSRVTLGEYWASSTS